MSTSHEKTESRPRRAILTAVVAGLTLLLLACGGWVAWTTKGRYAWLVWRMSSGSPPSLETLDGILQDEEGTDTFLDLLVSSEDPDLRLRGWNLFFQGAGRWDHLKRQAISASEDPRVSDRALGGVLFRLELGSLDPGHPGLAQFENPPESGLALVNSPEEDWATWWERRGRAETQWVYEELRTRFLSLPELQAALIGILRRLSWLGKDRRTETIDADFVEDVALALGTTHMRTETKLLIAKKYGEGSTVGLLFLLHRDANPEIAETATNSLYEVVGELRLLTLAEIKSVRRDPAQRKQIVEAKLETLRQELVKRGRFLPPEHASKSKR